MEGMKPRHWIQIGKLVNKEITITNPTFCIQETINLGLYEHIDKVY